MTLGLGDKVLGLHQKLSNVGLTHAFGGALALAYCTMEPRGTKDIDLNVFIDPEDVEMLTVTLGPEISVDRVATDLLRRDGQARVWWDRTPVDVFLSNHPFHDEARDRVRLVPFGDYQRLPVLACEDLAVFKAFFARPKDVLDIATMAIANMVDVDALRASVALLMGGYEERSSFFAKVDDTVTDLRRE